MLSSRLVKNWRIPVAWLLAVAVVCPISYFFFDRPVAGLIRAHLPKAVKQFAEWTTDAGDWLLGFFAVMAVTSRLVFKNKRVFRQSLFPLLAAAMAGILTTLFKTLVGRWRPKAYFTEGLYGFAPFHNANHASWPSGHSAGIMASMTAVAILFPKWRIPCFVIAALVGSTRIAVSAHYLGDVFAGLVLGYLCAHWLRHRIGCFLLKNDPGGDITSPPK